MIQVAGYVAFDHPLVLVSSYTGEAVTNVCHGVISASIWPESIGVSAEIRFPYGFQGHAKGFLYNPVVNGGDT